MQSVLRRARLARRPFRLALRAAALVLAAAAASSPGADP